MTWDDLSPAGSYVFVRELKPPSIYGRETDVPKRHGHNVTLNILNNIYIYTHANLIWNCFPFDQAQCFEHVRKDQRSELRKQAKLAL